MNISPQIKKIPKQGHDIDPSVCITAIYSGLISAIPTSEELFGLIYRVQSIKTTIILLVYRNFDTFVILSSQIVLCEIYK